MIRKARRSGTKLIHLALLGQALLLSACSEKVAGGGGMETGNGSSIAGKVEYPDGRAAVGALIRLRPKDFLQPPNGSGPIPAGSSTQVYADSNGEFAFGDLDTGSYILEASDEHAQGALLAARVEKAASQSVVHGELKPTGTITGVLEGNAGSQGKVQVYGLERLVVPDPSGAFRLEGMPEGEYVIHLESASPALAPVDLPRVRLQSAGEQDIGAVDLPPKGCGDFACDSLQVRALLDSNGHFNVTVASVVQAGSSPPRITALDLSGLQLTVLPAGIGRISILVRLDLSGNLLSALPSGIGALRALRTLDLSENRLTGLPAEIGKLAALAHLNLKQNRLAALPPETGRLRSLEYLDLQVNELTDLPATLTALGPLTLAAGDNRLCALAPAVQTWILENEPDYTPASQTCP